MFASISTGCINSSLVPDVCKTPGTPPAPVPYPNVALSVSHVPSQFNVVVGIGLLETLAAEGSISTGDEAGTLGGVVSGVVDGPDHYVSGSLKLMAGGFFATRLTSLTGHNGMPFNTTGAQLTPAQCHVVVLS